MMQTRSPSARGVEQSADGLLFRELVVTLRCLGGGQHVHRDLPLFQKIESLARHIEALFHSPREHDDRGAVIQQFLYISGLDARRMFSPGLAPVPFPRPTRKKLRVLVRLGFSLDLKPPPGDMLDLRRMCFFHNNNIVARPMRSCLP